MQCLGRRGHTMCDWRAVPTWTSLVFVTPATVSGPCMLYLYLWLYLYLIPTRAALVISSLAIVVGCACWLRRGLYVMTCLCVWHVYVSRGESAPIYQHAAHAGRAGGGMLTHPGQITGFPVSWSMQSQHILRHEMRCCIGACWHAV